MNILELAIEKDKVEKNHVHILMYIDNGYFLSMLGEDVNSVFFDELFASIQETGDHLIFTCSCGVADCGGWERINVTHDEIAIKWNLLYY